jgi:hypothetical protein
MTERDFINRKQFTELSPLLTYDRVRRHEKDWGLDQCRVPSIKKPVLYIRCKVIIQLTRIGLIW